MYFLPRDPVVREPSDLSVICDLCSRAVVSPTHAWFIQPKPVFALGSVHMYCTFIAHIGRAAGHTPYFYLEISNFRCINRFEQLFWKNNSVWKRDRKWAAIIEETGQIEQNFITWLKSMKKANSTKQNLEDQKFPNVDGKWSEVIKLKLSNESVFVQTGYKDPKMSSLDVVIFLWFNL